jgi:hypothetical protein
MVWSAEFKSDKYLSDELKSCWRYVYPFGAHVLTRTLNKKTSLR